MLAGTVTWPVWAAPSFNSYLIQSIFMPRDQFAAPIPVAVLTIHGILLAPRTGLLTATDRVALTQPGIKHHPSWPLASMLQPDLAWPAPSLSSCWWVHLLP